MEKLGKFLSSLTKSELLKLKEELNLTDDEELVFNELSKGRSLVATSDKCMVSQGTISTRVRTIQYKLQKVKKYYTIEN